MAAILGGRATGMGTRRGLGATSPPFSVYLGGGNVGVPWCGHAVGEGAVAGGGDGGQVRATQTVAEKPGGRGSPTSSWLSGGTWGAH